MSTEMMDMIAQFRAVMFDKFPYVSHYVYSLTPVPTSEIPTMAVDKHGRMYYNPEWSASLSIQEGGYVVQHEAWHLILGHCKLSEQIIGERPSKQDQFDLNVAMDVTIWEILESIAQYAPEGGVTLANAQAKWPAIKPNMTCLEIFEIIKKSRRQDDEAEEEEKDSEAGDGSGDSGENGNSDGSSDPSECDSKNATAGSEAAADADTESDTGGGSGDPSDEHPEQGVDTHGYDYGEVMGGGSSADGIERDYELESGDEWDAYLEDKLLKEVEKQVKEHERNEKWSPNLSSRGLGEVKRIIKERLHPETNPWDLLRRAIGRKISSARSASYTKTYQRMARRQHSVQRGVVLRGNKPLTPSACVILDTSASMTRACLKKAATVCDQGCRAVGSYRLILWDMDLQFDEMVTHPKKSWPDTGGGGTDMTAAVLYAIENHKPDVLILVTDGYTGWPTKEELGNTRLIVATTQETTPPDHCVHVHLGEQK